METFAERFERNKGAPIQYQGHELFTSYVLTVRSGDCISVRVLRAIDRPIQGIGIKCDKCEIRVSDTVGKSIALWTDTAPRDVLLHVGKAKAGAKVTFFNQWRDEKYGSTMYHLNNAAIQPEPQPDGSVLLRCSDGWGDPDLDDLVVQITLKSQ